MDGLLQAHITLWGAANYRMITADLTTMQSQSTGECGHIKTELSLFCTLFGGFYSNKKQLNICVRYFCDPFLILRSLYVLISVYSIHTKCVIYFPKMLAYHDWKTKENVSLQ